ncbi:MAG TPA: hypothetical protein DCP24_12950 [Nitrospiraceae bacterium]|nr:hypothetical protein [Nitrospiraceae bacterium]
MYLSSVFNYYRVGRFVFAITLLISFQVAGLPYAIPRLMSIMLIYCFITLLRLFIASERAHYFDFFLDIVFISAMVYISSGIHSYLTLLYLFPIFFSSVLIKTKKIFIFPIISALLYGIVHHLIGGIGDKESILNVSLHLLSFSFISLAGDNLKVKMEGQERHIKRLEEERIRMKGYERLYRVSADLAHELRNPLASISAAVQFLKEGRNDKEFIDMLESDTKRLTTLVNDFLLFSRPSDAHKEDVELSEMLRMLVKHQAGDKKISLNVEEDVIVIANRTFMDIAVSNIIKNASEAARSTVAVSLKAHETDAVIEIDDDGEGIDEDLKDKIFEPFVTTKADGTGLGLAIAYRIITGFGGNIMPDKSPLGGARFTIIFPIKGME